MSSCMGVGVQPTTVYECITDAVHVSYQYSRDLEVASSGSRIVLALTRCHWHPYWALAATVNLIWNVSTSYIGLASQYRSLSAIFS